MAYTYKRIQVISWELPEWITWSILAFKRFSASWKTQSTCQGFTALISPMGWWAPYHASRHHLLGSWHGMGVQSLRRPYLPPLRNREFAFRFTRSMRWECFVELRHVENWWCFYVQYVRGTHQKPLRVPISIYAKDFFFLKDALLDEGTLARDDGLLCYINRNKYNHKVHRRPGT